MKSRQRSNAAQRSEGPDDHKIRQLLLRHRRHGGPRLCGHADQRPPLFERGAGEGDAQGRGLRQVHGRARLRHVLDGRASFPARRDGIDPEPVDDGDAFVRRDPEHPDRLRFQRRADVASAAAGRRLCDGRHPDRRPGNLWRRARLPHPRGRKLRLAVDGPDRQPRDLRGRRRHPVQGVRGQTVLAQGQVLHDPAGGAVSRLHPEGDHPGAGAGAVAGRMLAADPDRARSAPSISWPSTAFAA